MPDLYATIAVLRQVQDEECLEVSVDECRSDDIIISRMRLEDFTTHTARRCGLLSAQKRLIACSEIMPRCIAAPLTPDSTPTPPRSNR